jgi:hypothetical protein
MTRFYKISRFGGFGKLIFSIKTKVLAEVGFNQSLYTSSKWLLLLYVFDGFFKQTLKPFLFMLMCQVLILERFFLLEYHIFKYLTVGGYYQNHVDNNIILLGCSCCYLFLEHGPCCVFIRVVINFMFNGIANDALVMMEPNLFAFS